MQNIDITIQKVCTTCKTETAFRYLLDHPLTLAERSTLELRIEPDEFAPCPKCGNPLHLRIKVQPYEPANHFDIDAAVAKYEQEYGRGKAAKSRTIETRKTDDGQFESTVQDLGVTVTAATEHDALNEALLAIHLNTMEEYKKMKREAEDDEKEQTDGR